VFFATVVGKLFFPADMPEWLRLMQTFGIFAAGYLARPLGGIVMAHFGDLLGRKRCSREHLHDGRTDLDHGLAAYLCADWHVGTDSVAADARDPGRGHWR
jgi:hypothetical protein